MEKFELQLEECFLWVSQTKTDLGSWTGDDIVFNRRSLLKNVRSLNTQDFTFLRKLYDGDTSVLMGAAQAHVCEEEVLQAQESVGGPQGIAEKGGNESEFLVRSRSPEVMQMALMLKNTWRHEQPALSSKPRNYEMRIIDSGCGRTVVNDYNMLSGNVVSCTARLGGIDPSRNVKEQLQAVASGSFELKLMYKGKSTKITLQNAMYVPGIEVTLISERDLGEAGLDVCKRDKGRTVSIERGRRIIGRYKSDRVKHNGLYMIDDYMKDEERSPCFNLTEIVTVLEEDIERSERATVEKAGRRTHLICTEACLGKKEGPIWGTQKCCLANSFHQRLGHVSLGDQHGHALPPTFGACVFEEPEIAQEVV
jgi:hypothetical protein